jgi:hypothetical protein
MITGLIKRIKGNPPGPDKGLRSINPDMTEDFGLSDGIFTEE